MKHSQLLQVLYDLALVSGSETRVDQLITKLLQRLLYHTPFSCGLFFSDLPIIDSELNNTKAKLLCAIGGGNIKQLQGKFIELPSQLIRKKAGIFEEKEVITEIFSSNAKYSAGLKLNINHHDMILLFAPFKPQLSFDLEVVLQPVLNNFQKNLFLCRENEKHTAKLLEELKKTQRLEQALKDSESMLKTVINTIPVRIFWKDRNLKYLGCNSAFAADVGISDSGEIVGKADENLLQNDETIRHYHNDDVRILQSGESHIDEEIKKLDRNGNMHWMQASKIPLRDSSNQVIGILGSYSDITERKQAEIALCDSEARHRAIFDTTFDGIITIDAKGYISSINPSLEKMFGYTSAELLGKNLGMLLPTPYAEQHKNFITSYLTTGIAKIIGVGRELVGRKKSGENFPVEISINEMYVNSQHMFTGILRDITERKQAEKVIMAAKEEAEQANLAKSRFLSSMSHELRTPLNAIIGFSQIIEMEENISEEVLDYNSEIFKAGQHLLNLINEILDLSRIEAGKVNLCMENVPLGPLLNDCMNLIKPLAEKHEISVICKEKQFEQLDVYADKTRLIQVLLNLMTNAIKYNRPGGEVSLLASVLNDTLLRISVVDTGTGIKQEKLEHLFEAFNRLGAEETNIEGSGIGLVITKQLAELMGGGIHVTSEYGMGSTFSVDIPCSLDQCQSQHQRQKISEINISPELRKNLSILYVENNPANAKLISQLIAKKTHVKFFTAHTAALGEELAVLKQPDLILLDLHLPDINGYQLKNNLKENPATNHIPVIAVTADAMSIDEEKAQALGFSDLIIKPIDAKCFYQKINLYLGEYNT